MSTVVLEFEKPIVEMEKKLEEVSDKLSKSTVDLVALEEQRMIGRIKLQDGVAELSLEKQEAKSKVAEK